MAEPTRDGCGQWIAAIAVAFALVLLFLGLFGSASEIPAAASGEIPMVATVVPHASDGYFVVENNQISYTSFPTLGKPCYYLISGRVLDLNGEPFTDYVINIMTVPIEGVVTEGPGYAFPGDGGFAEDGPSGYSTLLPNWQIAYEIWLTTEVGGIELSPHIIVPAHDCQYNRAIVNFVQVRPLA